MLPHMNLLGFFHTEKPKKKFFLNNPITKNQKTKQKSFSGLRQFSIFFHENFMDWLMQRALVWLNLYGHEAVWQAQKQPKNTKKAFFGCFRPYVGQPDDHIGWATLMPFVSIYSTNPRTNPWNFREKILRIGGVENLSFFESAKKLSSFVG